MQIELILYTAISPMILALISQAWKYPPILEEVVKWLILKFGKPSLGIGLWVGLTFGLSETVLYTLNGFSGGNWGVILIRLATTLPMHTLTAGITGFMIQKGKGKWGLLLAMAIHFLYNYFALLIN